MPGNAYVPYTINLKANKQYDIHFFPFKMQALEVFNQGVADVLVMINSAGPAHGITVYPGGSRNWSAQKGSFTRVGFLSTADGQVQLNASR